MSSKHLVQRSLAGGLVIAALSYPAAAQAMPTLDPAGAPSPISAAPEPPTTSAQSGFQWADAGIGAAGGVVLFGTGVVAAGAVRRRTAHRPATR